MVTFTAYVHSRLPRVYGLVTLAVECVHTESDEEDPSEWANASKPVAPDEQAQFAGF